MYRFAGTVLALFLTTCAVAQKINTLSKKEKKEGWQLLFNGSTTKGWHIYNKPGAPVGAGWKVEDGALGLDPAAKAGGNLTTDESFENFHLKLEWKVSENGNSGLMFYVQEAPQYDEPYKTGAEMQILDNKGHKDGQIHKHRTGDLYDLIASSSEPVKPVGEWNAVEIISNKGELTFILNGVEIVHTTMWNDAWKALIAGSKFKNMPGFGTFTSGKISLQDHGNAVWFRNVKVRKL